MTQQFCLVRSGNEAWGFRLIGGIDFKLPLTIVKVQSSSPAETSGLLDGDTLVSINGFATSSMTHDDANNAIREYRNILELDVCRGQFEQESPSSKCTRDTDHGSMPTEVFNDALSRPPTPYRPFSTEPVDIPPVEDPIILNPNYNDEFPSPNDDFYPETVFKLPISPQYVPDVNDKRKKALKSQVFGTKQDDVGLDLIKRGIIIVNCETVDLNERIDEIRDNDEVTTIMMDSNECYEEKVSKEIKDFKETKVIVNAEVTHEIDSKESYEEKVCKEFKEDINKTKLITNAEVTQIDSKQSHEEKVCKEVMENVTIRETASNLVSESIDKALIVAEEFQKELNVDESSVVEAKETISELISNLITEESTQKEKSFKNENEKIVVTESISKEENKIESNISNQNIEIVTSETTSESKDENVINEKTELNSQVTQANKEEMVTHKRTEYKVTNQSETSEMKMNEKQNVRHKDTESKKTTAQLLAEQRAYTIGLHTIPKIKGNLRSSYQYDLLLKTFFIHLTDVMVALSRFILTDQSEVVENEETAAKETIIENNITKEINESKVYNQVNEENRETSVTKLTGSQMSRLSSGKSEEITDKMGTVINELQQNVDSNKQNITEAIGNKSTDYKSETNEELKIYEKDLVEEIAKESDPLEWLSKHETQTKLIQDTKTMEESTKSETNKHVATAKLETVSSSEVRTENSSTKSENMESNIADGKKTYVAIVEAHVYTNKDAIITDNTESIITDNTESIDTITTYETKLNTELSQAVHESNEKFVATTFSEGIQIESSETAHSQDSVTSQVTIAEEKVVTQEKIDQSNIEISQTNALEKSSLECTVNTYAQSAAPEENTKESSEIKIEETKQEITESQETHQTNLVQEIAEITHKENTTYEYQMAVESKMEEIKTTMIDTKTVQEYETKREESDKIQITEFTQDLSTEKTESITEINTETNQTKASEVIESNSDILEAKQSITLNLETSLAISTEETNQTKISEIKESNLDTLEAKKSLTLDLETSPPITKETNQTKVSEIKESNSDILEAKKSLTLDLEATPSMPIEINTPTPTYPPTPLTDEYIFRLEIPVTNLRDSDPDPNSPTPKSPTPSDEDPHIVKKRLIPHIETTIESVSFHASNNTPSATAEHGFNDQDELREIERKSSLLAEAIDETIKSIEMYKEQAGLETYNKENYTEMLEENRAKIQNGEMEVFGTTQGIINGLDDEVNDNIGKPGMTEKKMTELISGESDMLREAHVMGLKRVLASHISKPTEPIDTQKIKPIIDNLRDSEVLKALNDEFSKTKVEKKKDDRKWTTFLQKPHRPVPKNRFGFDEDYVSKEDYKVKIVKQPKPKVAPDYKPADFETGPLPWEERAAKEPPPPPVPREDPILIPEENPEYLEAVDPLPESQVPDLEDTGIQLPPEEEPTETLPKPETVSEAQDQIAEEVKEDNTEVKEDIEVKEDLFEEKEQENMEKVAEQLVGSIQNMVDPNATVEQQLTQMKAQIAALSQLPAVIQQTLELVTRQISCIAQESIQTETVTETEVLSSETAEIVEEQSVTIEELQQETETLESVAIQEEKEEVQMEEAMVEERRLSEQEKLAVEQVKIEKMKKDVMTEMKFEQESRLLKQRPTPRVGKPQPAFGPLVPQERPLILPGGRKWRKPKDAFNEELFKEAMSAQAELIQGKAKGINFMKYEKPPVSLDHLKNSDVLKLLNNMEEPVRGVDRLTPVVAESDYRELCRSVTPGREYSQQVEP